MFQSDRAVIETSTLFLSEAADRNMKTALIADRIQTSFGLDRPPTLIRIVAEG